MVESFLADTNVNLEKGKNVLTFRGTLFTGLGEGGYYISLEGYAKNLAKGLGFVPYPGTLNLRLTSEAMIEQRRRLDLMKGVEVPGFSDGKRSFGPVKCFRAKVAGQARRCRPGDRKDSLRQLCAGGRVPGEPEEIARPEGRRRVLRHRLPWGRLGASTVNDTTSPSFSPSFPLR